MKFENIIIIFHILLLLLCAIAGIENPTLSWYRPAFTITMDLAVVFVIIGYNIGYARDKKYEQARKDLIKYLKEHIKEKQNGNGKVTQFRKN